VDGGSLERCLDRRATLERAGERVALEVGQPRPEAYVAGRRVLGLQAADLLEGLGNWDVGAFEQQLAGKERAIERAPGKNRLCDRVSPPTNRS
jgi:hypothetical protein